MNTIMKTRTNFLNGIMNKDRVKIAFALAIFISILFFAGCSDFFSESKSIEQAKSETVQGPPLSGKVVNAIRGGGYTYLHLENSGRKFWVASSVINVKRNDTVLLEGGTVMTDFTSFALNKQFDEIHFVKAVKIVR